MRRDAEQNREKLVAATSELMRSEGGDFPLERILERSGLTRATFYRNFPHRQAVYEAVLERDLGDLAGRLSGGEELSPLAFIRLTAEVMMVYDKFLVALATMPDYDAGPNRDRMAQTLASPLAEAQAQGFLRADLTGDDMLTVCLMLASNWLLDAMADYSEAFEGRLRLLMQGLVPTHSSVSASMTKLQGKAP